MQGYGHVSSDILERNMTRDEYAKYPIEARLGMEALNAPNLYERQRDLFKEAASCIEALRERLAAKP